jgi:hypothetical protein
MIDDVRHHTTNAEFRESFHDLCVVDNKSSLKDFMKLIADKINSFAEKSDAKASSSVRFIAVFEILIVCYRMIETGFFEADIRKHILKKYIINTVHPKYKGLCLFEIMAKVFYPNLRGDSLHKKACDLCFDFNEILFE